MTDTIDGSFFEKYQKILVMDSMLQGQEEERKRIAKDLHNGLGSVLAAARIKCEMCREKLIS